MVECCGEKFLKSICRIKESFLYKSCFKFFSGCVLCYRGANAPREKGFFAFGGHKGTKQREGFCTWYVGLHALALLANLLCKVKNWAFIR